MQISSLSMNRAVCGLQIINVDTIFISSGQNLCMWQLATYIDIMWYRMRIIILIEMRRLVSRFNQWIKSLWCSMHSRGSSENPETPSETGTSFISEQLFITNNQNYWTWPLTLMFFIYSCAHIICELYWSQMLFN